MPRLFRHREAVHIWRSASRRCSRARCHPDELGAALRKLGFTRHRQWHGATGFQAVLRDRDKLGSCAIDCTYLSNDVADNEALSAFGGGFKKNQGRKLVKPGVT